MTPEEQQYIDAIAESLGKGIAKTSHEEADNLRINSHNAKDREVSGLFSDIDDKLVKFEHILDTILTKSTAHDEVHVQLALGMEKGFAKVDSKQDFQNGRVKTNEIRMAYAMGGLAVVSLVAVPILAWALFALVNIGDTIDDRINRSLSTYEFVISE